MRLGAPVLLFTCVGCGGGAPTSTTVAPAPIHAKICDAPLEGVFAVMDAENQTDKEVNLRGTDALLSANLIDTGCFTLAERDKVKVLIEEMKLCSSENPDVAFFNCDSFAKKGELLGVTHFVFSDLVVAEDDIESAALSVKIPDIGSLEAGVSYDALGLSVRVVKTETGIKLAQETTHAVVRSSGGGFSLGKGPLNFSAAAAERTPVASAIDTMLWDSASRIAQALKATPPVISP